MSRNRRKPNPTLVAARASKPRWDKTTRAQTFADRKAVASKRACRGRVSFD
jgi:hypothetical protein